MSARLNETHDPSLTSWVESANSGTSDFPVQNLPFCVFRRAGSDEAWRGGVAIGDQVVDLGLGHGGEVADLAEAEGLGIGLEHLDRQPDDVGDRRRTVVVAHDAAGGSGGATADPALVEHEHVGAALGEAPRGR